MEKKVYSLSNVHSLNRHKNSAVQKAYETNGFQRAQSSRTECDVACWK
jgi:hypothetical protein